MVEDVQTLLEFVCPHCQHFLQFRPQICRDLKRGSGGISVQLSRRAQLLKFSVSVHCYFYLEVNFDYNLSELLCPFIRSCFILRSLFKHQIQFNVQI